MAVKRKAVKVSFVAPRAALEIWRFAGGGVDESRGLHAVRFEPETVGKSKVMTIHAIACDGHRLLHASWTADKGDVLPESISLSAAAIKDFLKKVGRPKKGDVPPVFRVKREGYRFDDKKVPEYILGTEGVMATVSVPGSPPFPEWRHVIAPPQSGTQEVSTQFGINLEYLVDLGKYFKACGIEPMGVVHYADSSGCGPVRIEPAHVGDELNAVENGVEAEYIQMPVRT